MHHKFNAKWVVLDAKISENRKKRFQKPCISRMRLFVDSMCCARTAALHCGNEKQKVNASKVFLQQSLQHVEKCRQERNVCQHMANLGLQNRGWSVPSREKNDQKGRQMQQDAKNAPKKRLRAKNVPT